MSTDSIRILIRALHRRDCLGDFDQEILINRLDHLGVKQILDEKGIHEFGFPFKYNCPLDEAILMMHYFLARSELLKRSHIKIRSIHVPTREEENNLSFWKSAKAGMYLDLHSMILLSNRDKKGRKNQIKRLFVFRDNAQLAHLESVGIAVILEQQSIGIDTGFIFSKYQKDKTLKLLKGMLLIELLHPEKDKCEWALIIDLDDYSSIPYKNVMICKWFKGKIEDDKTDKYKLNSKEFNGLFRFEKRQPNEKIGHSSYTFEEEPQRFKTLLVNNFIEAVQTLPGSKELISRYEDTVSIKRVPAKLEEFNTAITLIKKSRKIYAIDATSVKSTLKVHETDANYRHWIRTTLTTVLENPDGHLERIYIIDAPNGIKDDYELLREELDLYYDYLRREIQSLKEIWDVSDSRVIKKLQANVRIFVITKTALEQFCEDSRLEQFYEGSDPSKSKKDRLLGLASRVVERQEEDPLQIMMPRLDFLYAEYVIYNYKDYRGEPSQPEYTADLFAGPRIDPTRHYSKEELEDHNRARDEFDKTRDVFAELFNSVKELSEPILLIKESGGEFAVESGQLPSFDDLELRLDEKREAYFVKLTQESSTNKGLAEDIMKKRNWLYAISKFVSTALGPFGAPIEAGLELDKAQEADRANTEIQAMIQKTQELQTTTLRVLLGGKLTNEQIDTVAGVIEDVVKYGQGDLDKSYGLLTAGIRLSDSDKGNLMLELVKRFGNREEVQTFHAFLDGASFPTYLLEPSLAAPPYFNKFVTIFSGLPLLIQRKVVDTIQSTLQFSPMVFAKYKHID